MLLVHAAGKKFGGHGLRLVGRGARGAEDDDLAHMAIGRENVARVAQFLQRAVEEFQVGDGRLVAAHLQRGDDHFLDDLARLFAARVADELADALVERGVAGGGAATGDGWKSAGGEIGHVGES